MVFTYGEDIRSLRLESKLSDLRSGYAHTDEIGILPGEEIKHRISTTSVISRDIIPSGNTHCCAGRNNCVKIRSCANKTKKGTRMSAFFVLAAELGFEPRHTESESAVLPLHNSAIC